MDIVIEKFLNPQDMFLDPNNNTNQDVVMKSKSKKNSLRLQSMINRCKLLSLSDSDEEHKNKEEKTLPSKLNTNSITTKIRTASNHSLYSRTRNSRSPFSHKLMSGKRKRNYWSDADNNRAHSSQTTTIELKETTTSIANKDYEKKNIPKKYPQRMDCQRNVQHKEQQSKQLVKKADISQDFYGDDEASDFFDSSQSCHSSTRVRRVKIRHFREPPITSSKYDLNTQTFRKRRKVI